MGGLEDGTDVQRSLEITERRQLFLHHFGLLDERCRQLLRLFLQGTSMRRIAERLGIATEHAVRNRKYRCQKKLEDRILADPAYREHQP